jgi:hypothetical protein
MRPDQQHGFVLDVMDADGRAVACVIDECKSAQREKSWKGHLVNHDLAREAVAEYITANDEYDLMLAVKAEAIRHGAELYKMAAIDKDIQKATERRALARARMKGGAK